VCAFQPNLSLSARFSGRSEMYKFIHPNQKATAAQLALLSMYLLWGEGGVRRSHVSQSEIRLAMIKEGAEKRRGVLKGAGRH